jgi:DNA mismatch repair protein MutS2
VREEKLDELETYKEQLAISAEKLKTETQIMELTKNKYKELIRKFDIEKKAYLEKAVERAEKKLEKLIEEFKANPNISKTKAQFPEIIKSTGTSKGVQTLEDFQKQFTPGSTAYIMTLGQDGIIQGLPNAKGEVTVLSRSMRLQVHWKDIRASKSQMSQVQFPQKMSTQQMPQDELEIDLRGMTADQAIDELEKALDKALQDQIDQIKIIHGHGTETLKKSVRSYLSRSVYIQKWKAGSIDGNDDGVTFAVLS